MQNDQNLGDMLQAKLDELRRLRDETRVNLHLASMELKDEWQKLEKKLPDPATVKEQFKDKAAETIDRLTSELRDFSRRLRGGN